MPFTILFPQLVPTKRVLACYLLQPMLNFGHRRIMTRTDPRIFICTILTRHITKIIQSNINSSFISCSNEIKLISPIAVYARVTRRVPLVEQDLTLPENLSSPPVFRGVRVTRSFIFCIVFCR
jgi:hypothetical protein